MHVCILSQTSSNTLLLNSKKNITKYDKTKKKSSRTTAMLDKTRGNSEQPSSAFSKLTYALYGAFLIRLLGLETYFALDLALNWVRRDRQAIKNVILLHRRLASLTINDLEKMLFRVYYIIRIFFQISFSQILNSLKKSR